MTIPLRRTLPRLTHACLTALLVAGMPLPGSASAVLLDPMADMSIEELANIQITSVSKKPEALADAAASVYVITADAIRRSGADSLPEALRLAPNLQVAQVSGSGYAITARGLNGSTTSAPNKLLVLIDGRSVYSPMFSGVFWDAQDVLMDDIDRIEVISGPGGTLWGVNAVNGVVNVITRGAQDTQGTLAALSAGSRGADGAVRRGGRSGGIDWRVYAKHLDRKHTALASSVASGGRVNDARHQSQIGFRADWESGADRVTVHGDAYRGRSEQAEPGSVSTGVPLQLGNIETAGANLTGLWKRSLASGGRVSVQAYLERTLRTVPPTFRQALNMADVQFMHSLPERGAHSLAWGANYRRSHDVIDNSVHLAFMPGRDGQTWASVFAQDEIVLGEAVRATLGARVERNDYTGAEWLPTARLTWKVAPAHTLWAGLSRTVRAPTRLDADVFIPGVPPYVLQGGPAVRAEVAKVAELGYRGQPAAGLSASVTVFYNDYDHLRTTELGPDMTYLVFGNRMHGRASGIEAWGSYQLSPRWRLAAGMTGLHERLSLKAGSFEADAPGTAGKNPSHTVSLRSTYDLGGDKELEVALRKVAALSNPDVPGYTALDARLQWLVSKALTVSLTGRNLNGGHGEYGAIGIRTEVPRSVALRLVWQQ